MPKGLLQCNAESLQTPSNQLGLSWEVPIMKCHKGQTQWNAKLWKPHGNPKNEMPQRPTALQCQFMANTTQATGTLMVNPKTRMPYVPNSTQCHSMAHLLTQLHDTSCNVMRWHTDAMPWDGLWNAMIGWQQSGLPLPFHYIFWFSKTTCGPTGWPPWSWLLWAAWQAWWFPPSPLHVLVLMGPMVDNIPDMNASGHLCACSSSTWSLVHLDVLVELDTWADNMVAPWNSKWCYHPNFEWTMVQYQVAIGWCHHWNGSPTWTPHWNGGTRSGQQWSALGRQTWHKMVLEQGLGPKWYYHAKRKHSRMRTSWT